MENAKSHGKRIFFGEAAGAYQLILPPPPLRKLSEYGSLTVPEFEFPLEFPFEFPFEFPPGI